MKTYEVGDTIAGRRIRDFVNLSNGWRVLKTDGSKSTNDFIVRTIYQWSPRVRSYVPKHAHFTIDLYGKICDDKIAAMDVFWAIIEVWKGKRVSSVLKQYHSSTQHLAGYSIEYILYALDWILDQEDINFTSRPVAKQTELNAILGQLKIKTPKGRLGSELGVSLLCDIVSGKHPVDAFFRVGLDVLPRWRR